MTAILVQKNDLLDEVTKLNTTFEASGVMLAVGLVRVLDTEAWKEAGYDTWPEYYRNELGRERTQISKMLKAGRYIIEHGLLANNIRSYQYLASAISANPGETPEKVVAVANSWTPGDFAAQKRDDCAKHEFVMKCKHCGAYEEGH